MRNCYIFAGLTFVLALALSVTAAAQAESHQQAQPDQSVAQASSPGDMHQERGPEARLDWLSQQLNLTDEQKEKLKPILADESRQMKAVRDDTSLTADQKHDKMKQIKASTRPQIEAILTPEQRQKFAQIREEGKERGAEKKGTGQDESQKPQH